MAAELTTPLTHRFTEATAYALEKHRTQARKGGEIPYAAHLLAVAAIALEMGCTEDEAIAALLHDVIEDQGGTEAELEIRDRFGADVAVMVRANSDTDVIPKPPWRRRKEDYIAGITGRAATGEIPAIDRKPIGAVRVSIADKLHNAQAILTDHRRLGDEVWDRFSVSDPGQILWYYEELVGAFEQRRDELGEGAAAALDELERTVSVIRERVD